MKTLIFIIFISFATVTRGQGNFMVYRVNGDVKLKVAKQKKPVMIGQLINISSSLLLGNKSSVVLICQNYIPFTINKPGNYILSQFLDSCVKQSYSLASGYFKYIWKQMTHTEGSPGEDRRNFMRNTGAVIRGYPCNEIIIDPLFDTVNSTANIRISWKMKLPLNKLFIEVYDAEKDGSLLYRKAVSNNQFLTDTIKKYAEGNNTVYWNFVMNGKEICTRKLIHFWDNGSYKEYLKQVMNSIPTGLGKSERFSMMGFILEADHFFAGAKEFYKKALVIDPKNKAIRDAIAELK